MTIAERLETLYAERAARALGNDPAALALRLREAATDLVPELRTRMRNARFDTDNRRLVGDGVCLAWRLRRWPERPETYENQQTSRGYVTVEGL